MAAETSNSLENRDDRSVINRKLTVVGVIGTTLLILAAITLTEPQAQLSCLAIPETTMTKSDDHVVRDITMDLSEAQAREQAVTEAANVIDESTKNFTALSAKVSPLDAMFYGSANNQRTIDSKSDKKYWSRAKAKTLITVSPSEDDSPTVTPVHQMIANTLAHLTNTQATSRVTPEGIAISPVQKEKLEASFLEAMDYILLESTNIPIVIDQPINSELPGRLRGIVASNVWSADGRRILIPRGTKAMGEYSATSERGQTRIYAIWTRLLDPMGIDIPIASPANDRLGVSGLHGQRKTRFFHRFRSARLVSINVTPTVNLAKGSLATIYVNQDINFYKAYQEGLAKKAQLKQEKLEYLASGQTSLTRHPAGANFESSILANPNPLGLGLLPNTHSIFRRVGDQPSIEGLKTRVQLKRVAALAPDECPKIFPVTKDRLFSVLVQEYLFSCGYVLDGWLPIENDSVKDWRFIESANISMPQGTDSLRKLLKQYSIKLVADSVDLMRYRVASVATAKITIEAR